MRNTTLGLVAIPAAIGTARLIVTTATGAAIGDVASSAGKAVLKEGKAIVRGVSKAGKEIVEKVKGKALQTAVKVENTPVAKHSVDFGKGLNPFSGEAPNPKSYAEAAGVVGPYAIKALDRLGVWDKIGAKYNKNLNDRYEARFNFDTSKILPSR